MVYYSSFLFSYQIQNSCRYYDKYRYTYVYSIHISNFMVIRRRGSAGGSPHGGAISNLFNGRLYVADSVSHDNLGLNPNKIYYYA